MFAAGILKKIAITFFKYFYCHLHKKLLVIASDSLCIISQNSLILYNQGKILN